MWAFRQFPDKIEYTPPGEERPTYQAEVFGYLYPEGGLETGPHLVCFRRITLWVHKDVGEIRFLPAKEFEEEFKDYLLEGGQEYIENSEKRKE